MNPLEFQGRASGLRRGQAMILAVLAMGGAILGATTIAGLLMTYQLHQTGDAGSSAKALFAADAGVECGLYNFAGPAGHSPAQCGGSLSDAAYTLTFDPSAQTLYSEGFSGTAHRAFIVLLNSATTTITN